MRKAFMLFAALALVLGLVACGSEEPPTQEEIVAQSETAVLQVVTRTSGTSPVGSPGQIIGTGSAWVVDAEEGYIVTNAHVVVDGSKFTAGFDSTQQTKASVVGIDLANDIAVLRVSPTYLEGLTELSLADAPSEQGEAVVALGYPGNGNANGLQTPYQSTSGDLTAVDGVQATVGYGYIVNENSGIVQSDLYQTDAAINPGNSGGPLVNADGEVVGVNYAGGNGENQGFAISAEKLHEILPALIEGDSNGWAGFAVSSLSGQEANTFGIPGALEVSQVTKDTPADQAGLGQLLSGITKSNSILLLLEVNNQPISDMQQYVNALESIESGERVMLTLAAPGYGVEQVPITYP